MVRASGMDDMFGHVAQAAELPLGDEPMEHDSPLLRLLNPLRPGGETAESVRANLHKIIDHLRQADTLPWDAYYVRLFSGLVPYMAEWLKGGEGDALMAEFKAELDRLGAPDNQVAPNWRKLWGIAA